MGKGASHFHLLHVSKLDPFKEWLTANGIAMRDGKGPYQVLQVNTPAYGWQSVFRKDVMPEHYSVNGKMESLIRRFIKETREPKEQFFIRTRTISREEANQLYPTNPEE